jgi:RNA polymerase sigma-70 factor (ECF subfamily)
MLIRRYRDRVGGFVYSLLSTDDALEDVCHSIFLKMIAGLPRLKAPESFESWLFRIARNACADFIRRKRLWRIFVPLELKHEEVVALPLDEADDRIARIAAFRAALGQLPRRQRELIILLADRDWSYEELAAITGSSIGAVKSRLFRARESLRRSIIDEEQRR